MFILKICILITTLVLVVSAAPDRPIRQRTENEEYLVPREERRPYSFAYSASRHYNGAPDREHAEERDENGITRGVFRYIDPRHQVQEVIYTSDSDGFHINRASNTPRDTAVVLAAKSKHEYLFNKIKQEHQQIAEDLEESNKKYEEEQRIREEEERYDQINPHEIRRVESPIEIDLKSPEDSPVVARAKQRHQYLYEKIRQEHEERGKELAEMGKDYVEETNIYQSH